MYIVYQTINRTTCIILGHIRLVIVRHLIRNIYIYLTPILISKKKKKFKSSKTAYLD